MRLFPLASFVSRESQQAQRTQEKLTYGQPERTLDISTWAPGTYYFRFLFQGRQELRKVMIL